MKKFVAVLSAAAMLATLAPLRFHRRHHFYRCLQRRYRCIHQQRSCCRR